jgi:hypothetical protein
MYKPPSIEQIIADQQKKRVDGTPAKPAPLRSARNAAEAMLTKALEEIGGQINQAIMMNAANKVHMPHRITHSVPLLKSVITELEKLGYRIVANDGHVKGFDIYWDLEVQEEPKPKQFDTIEFTL